MQLYFAEPYRFVAPYRSTFWCRLVAPLIPTILRRHLGVRRWELRGTGHLRAALLEGAGVLLTSNHCHWPDPVVLAALGLEAGTFFHYVVAHYVFRQGRLFGWCLHRLGGYGINREGADREAVRTSAQLLAEGGRPLVVFPEGTWYLQNDRLGPLREGVAVITRRAAQQSRRPLVILPVALKYWLLEDARPVLARRLARLEARITGSSLDHLPLVPRIEALTDGLLAREEAGHMGQALTGPIDRRRLDLADAIVSGLEASCGGAPQAGSLMERVLRLRRLLVPRLVEAAPRPQECAAIQRQLQHLLLCQGLFGHSHAYLCEQPGLERLSEAVQRLEEIVTGEPEQPVAPLGAVVEVGAPLPVRERLGAGRGERKAGARLVEEVAGRTQAMLDGLLAEGPPAAWHCPPRDAVMAQEARALVAPEPPSAVR